jgi:hypothetical protein
VDSLGGGVDGDVAGDFWEEGESGAAFVYCEEGRDLAVATRMCLQYGSLRDVDTLSDELTLLAWNIGVAIEEATTDVGKTYCRYPATQRPGHRQRLPDPN